MIVSNIWWWTISMLAIAAVYIIKQSHSYIQSAISALVTMLNAGLRTVQHAPVQSAGIADLSEMNTIPAR